MNYYTIIDLILCDIRFCDGFKRREHINSKWCSQEELKGLDWAAADVGVVKSIL